MVKHSTHWYVPASVILLFLLSAAPTMKAAHTKQQIRSWVHVKMTIDKRCQNLDDVQVGFSFLKQAIVLQRKLNCDIIDLNITISAISKGFFGCSRWWVLIIFFCSKLIFCFMSEDLYYMAR